LEPIELKPIKLENCGTICAYQVSMLSVPSLSHPYNRPQAFHCRASEAKPTVAADQGIWFFARHGEQRENHASLSS
jgi:hypothetical protein